MWWVFVAANALAASAAQATAFALLPQDTLVSGQTAPIQVTKQWDAVHVMTDGRLAIRLKPGMTTPSALSVTLTDAQIAAFFPTPLP